MLLTIECESMIEILGYSCRFDQDRQISNIISGNRSIWNLFSR